jgi:hypothetical protein
MEVGRTLWPYIDQGKSRTRVSVSPYHAIMSAERQIFATDLRLPYHSERVIWPGLIRTFVRKVELRLQCLRCVYTSEKYTVIEITI